MTDQKLLAGITADIVSAYVSKNPVQMGDLPNLIFSVSTSLGNLAQPQESAAQGLVPPVNPKRSIHPDYLISLEDGKKYKSLRRHLGVRGLTPDEYRQKWGLPHDYPMVAKNYAATRSELAKKLGLGRKPRKRGASNGK